MPFKNGLNNSPPFTLFTISHGEPHITYDIDGKKITGFNGEDTHFFEEIGNEINRRTVEKKKPFSLYPLSLVSMGVVEKIRENLLRTTAHLNHIHFLEALKSGRDPQSLFRDLEKFIRPAKGTPKENSTLIIVGPEKAISAIRKSIWVPEERNREEQENGEKRGERETAYVGEFIFRQEKLYGTLKPLFPKESIKEGYSPTELEGGVLLK